MKNFLGFTLSEVLITLGIVGVVAALTLPTLIAKYNRSVVEVKLKKFNTVINQAVQMSIAENGAIPAFDNNAALEVVTSEDNDAKRDFIKNWYNAYIIKYLNGKFVENTEAHTYKGIKVKLPDGTGFTSTMSYTGSVRNTATIYLMYCVNASKCDLDVFDGKTQFLFEYSPEKGKFYTSYVNSPRDIYTLKYHSNLGCYNTDILDLHRPYCTRLIEMNGWKIPDDYPFIK